MPLLLPEFCECDTGGAAAAAELELVGRIDPIACLGEPYEGAPLVQGGTPPLTFTALNASDLALWGFTLDSATGQIGGTPVLVGSLTIEFEVESSDGQTINFGLTITVEICDCEGEPLVGTIEGPDTPGEMADVDEPLEGTVGGP